MSNQQNSALSHAQDMTQSSIGQIVPSPDALAGNQTRILSIASAEHKAPVEKVEHPAAAPKAVEGHAAPAAHEGAHGAAKEGAHGAAKEGGHAHEHTPELDNFFNLVAAHYRSKPDSVIYKVVQPFDPYVSDPAEATVHKTNQNLFFSLLTVFLAIMLARWAMRKRAMIPDRAQSAAEMLIEGLYDFFINILGKKHGTRYTTFLIGLFCYLFCNNLMGIIPFMKASTSAFQNNIILGFTVFLYVHYTGLRYNGPKNYFLHLLGNPQGPIMWIMSPLLFCIEVVGELIKPFSLSLRLFGNLMGEDIVLGVFAMLGIMITALCLKPFGFEGQPLVGIPLHLPFLFLSLLTCVIQALIFSMLSCVYIFLMLPHDHEEGEEHSATDHDH